MSLTSFENETTFLTYEQADALDHFHEAYESALADTRDDLGGTFRLRIGNRTVDGEGRFKVYSPGDRDLLVGRFPEAGIDGVEEAVASAVDARAAWIATDWTERVALFRDVAERMADRSFELAALITLENGKNRIEAIADVDEAIDFLRYYSDELERHEGYTFETVESTGGQRCTNVLRPYGVIGVIAPFNFPLAILTGMTVGAVMTGNTAIVKPAERAPAIAHAFFDLLDGAGLAPGVVNLVTGHGEPTGAAIVDHEDVDGIVFTGSRAVGLAIQDRFRELEKRGPVIAELGGKNPVIVTESADLDKAVSGVTNGAFSFSGQKCSATSRVYVAEDRYDAFVDRAIAAAESLPIHPPGHPDAFVSPLISDDAVERYEAICETARAVGRVRTGGEVLTSDELPDGRYVRPTVVTDVPHDHELAREEHFVPFYTIHRISDLDEAITLANDSDYGLCAGLFTEDEGEVERWFDRIESGMCYVNRSQSATTGALVHAQPFGGWKFSGTTGKFAGGRWYLPQFMCEQSQTVVREEG